jgi:hypothetical protein
MDESSSSASEADENKEIHFLRESTVKQTGIHPLVRFLPRQISNLLVDSGGIPVTGMSSPFAQTSRYVTPYLRQNRDYPAGAIPSPVLISMKGLWTKP